MKKLFSFLAMVLTALGIQAQSWEAPTPEAYNGETVIYASLTVNKPSQWVIGAFIDGSCRASASAYSEEPLSGGAFLYTIRVRGDKDGDANSIITFKVCDVLTGFEYLLMPDEDLKFGEGLTYGEPSNPKHFNLNVATGHLLVLTEVEVGETYNLMDYLQVGEPSNGVLPLNPRWRITPAEYAPYVTLNGDTLTGVAPYTGLRLEMTDPLGNPYQECYFDVVKPATGINLLQTTKEVSKESLTGLQAFMMRGVSYELIPSDASDTVLWEVDPEAAQDILGWDPEGYYTPQKGGTTRIRPYVLKRDGETKIYPTGWITVTVVVYATTIDVDYTLFGDPVKANVGDSLLLERLKRVIHVYPEDATDTTYTINIQTPDLLSFDGEKLRAIGAGSATVDILANGTNPNWDPMMTPTVAQATIHIDIENPARSINILQNPLPWNLSNAGPENISEEVRGNVQFLTANNEITEMANGSVSLSGTSVTANEAGLGANGLEGTYMAEAEGTTTITITLEWPDYDSWGLNNDNVLHNKTTQASFNVVVGVQLQGFNVTYANAVAGATGVLTLTPQPEGAAFNPDNIVVSVVNGLDAAWGSQLTATKKSASTSQIVYEVNSTIPGQAIVNVFNGTERVRLNNKYEPLVYEIGYPITFDSGWQWRSNPCGVITPAQFSTVFTSALVEIRTKDDLLYNDPQWGLFGSLNSAAGILQDQCYKLKMKSEQSAVLWGSTIMADPEHLVAGTINDGYSLTIVLKPGWNWVGSPYFFDRKVTTVFPPTAAISLPVGTTIIGKTDGQIELTANGWNGNLQVLKSGQGYLIKNPGTNSINLIFPSEFSMTPGNESAPSEVKAFGASHRVWKYDHSRFMDNMTMVAELENLSNPEHYSIGAFVGDECRGEGVVMDGKAYITVHCNPGEYVTFQLYNKFTSEFISVEEGLKAQTRVGSLQAPYRLHANQTVDGINALSGNAGNTETYDVSGRRIANQKAGVGIRRTADGKLHKVIVK